MLRPYPGLSFIEGRAIRNNSKQDCFVALLLAMTKPWFPAFAGITEKLLLLFCLTAIILRHTRYTLWYAPFKLFAVYAVKGHAAFSRTCCVFCLGKLAVETTESWFHKDPSIIRKMSSHERWEPTLNPHYDGRSPFKRPRTNG